MEKKTYLNNISPEDLSLIKTDIQNLNDYYTKTFKSSQNNPKEKEDSKQNQEEIKNNNNNNIPNNNIPQIKIKDSRDLSSPIINPEYSYNFIKSETKSKSLSGFKLSSL